MSQYLQYVAIFMVLVILQTSNLAIARQSTSTPPPNPVELKKRLVEIPTGSIVQVKLKDKTKIKGKLGEVTDEHFVVQAVRDDKVENVQIAYAEVRSVDQHGKGMGTAGKVTLGILAGVGVFVVIMIIVAAATGWD